MKNRLMFGRAVFTAAGVMLTAQTLFGGNVWHVNNKASNASDSNPGTEAAPFLTINAATTNSLFEAGDTVLVHPGVYDTGVVQINTKLGNTRVHLPKKTILKAASDDVGATVIKGGFDSRYSNGLGPKAIRCIFVGKIDENGKVSDTEAAGSEISGFTLCDGATLHTDSSEYSGFGGGVYSPSTKAYVVDCVISNCAAYKGGGTFGCTSVRCLFKNNRAKGSSSGSCGSAVNGGNLLNCVIDGCTGERGDASLEAVLSSCKSVNCTIVNCRSGVQGASGKNGIYNSVICVFSDFDAIGTISVSNCATTAQYGYYQLFAPKSGDYRLLDRGGARDLQCSFELVEDVLGELPEEYLATDFAGNAFPGSGTCLPGAVQEKVRSTYVDAVYGGLNVPNGVLDFDGNESVAISYDVESVTRPIIGMIVNGTTNLFDEVDEVTVSASEGSYVEAIYTKDWYVDASAESSDVALGCTPGAAKRTFKELFDLGLVLPGDTVRVAEGVYSDDVMYPGEEETDGARVMVPPGVLVVADGQVEKTIIRGEKATINPDEIGLGTNAVRCVSLGEGSVIKGFTLTGGYTDKNKVGGGVFGRDTGSSVGRVIDCVISNNFACRGAAAYVTLEKCRVLENVGTYCNGAFWVHAIGSIFSKNRGGVTCVMNPHSLLNCTVCNDNEYDKSGNDRHPVWMSSSGGATTMKNCIFAQKMQLSKARVSSVHNCFFSEMPALLGNTDSNECRVVGADNLKLDAEGRPVIGHNAAVDSANAEYYGMDEYGDKDLSGAMRVMNGKLDAGALEADWRNVYADIISGGCRAFSVVSASQNVVGAVGSSVKLHPGERLETVWKKQGNRLATYTTTFRVTGNGTLTVTVDGKDYTYTSDDGDVTLKVLSKASLMDIAFAYVGGKSDTGFAEILSSERDIGLSIVIR